MKTSPTKTVKAYKLFRLKDGKLFPLYVNSRKEVPVGIWIDAEEGEMKDGKVKSLLGPLAYRPGWHAGDSPVATHIGTKYNADTDTIDTALSKPTVRPDTQVWVEVLFPDDFDWQSVANSRAGTTKTGKVKCVEAHITDQIPVSGHYRYKTNNNMTGEWLIGGSMKVVKVLSRKEVTDINRSQGIYDLPTISELKVLQEGL